MCVLFAMCAILPPIDNTDWHNNSADFIYSAYCRYCTSWILRTPPVHIVYTVIAELRLYKGFLKTFKRSKIIHFEYFDLFFKVPMGFSFVHVFDMYFKIHKIFNFKYHKSLAQLMLITENYIFGMNQNNELLTTNSLKNANKIFGVNYSI